MSQAQETQPSESPLINRDLSWLSFNHRVLQEAKDPSTPLYERLKFLAIYSSNLDEFFRVRVSRLRKFRDLKKETRRKFMEDVKPKRELSNIQETVNQQQIEFGHIFRNEIIPALKAEHIFLQTGPESFTELQRQEAIVYFEQYVRPLLKFELISESNAEVPFLINRCLYFIVQFEFTDELGLVNIPSEDLPRFYTFKPRAGKFHIAFLDDIIRANLPAIFEKSVKEAFSIKTSRDAELYIEDEFSGDLIEKIKTGLEERSLGLPTRFLYDLQMDDHLLNRLRIILELKKNDLFPGGRYHNFHDLFSFPNPTGNPAFHYPPLPPLPHPLLERAPSLIELIDTQDVMLHLPYQRYDYIPKLIWEAAEDPEVQYIKITLYRVAARSAVVTALLRAREKGKQITVFIEAKARFDEASNLYWGEQLKQAGAEVIYSYPGIKVHTKLLLIGRKEGEKIRHYAYLGTGNFNEKTAKLYCDHALLTADPRLADEVNQIFGLLERKVILPKCDHLFVSPFNTRERFVALVGKEIEVAKSGGEAYIILKMNSLEDEEMIECLYEASRAGVKINLIVRGICSLAPAIPGHSEHIKVISIVDRFLEHARVYIFGNGGQEIMYTASADWMERNLDKRIEVVIPIYNPAIFDELRDIINFQLSDNTKARWITFEQDNPYKEKKEGEKAVQAQVDTYRYLAAKVK